jgi:N-acetylglucosaminyldiphosphoundecaprenol N-acetyl-beta-D-mannosaminyltransferase|uniref:WecB/TagA/CpsF family glycosyltransferase n=1 Tax=Desulfobacca acetoxidans TaxID=60893 RepID=A0A7C5AN77_9BACT
MSLRAIRVLGVKVTPGTLEELHREISRLIYQGKPGVILSANAHSLNLCQELPWLKAFYEQADLVYVDGAGVSLGAWLLGRGRYGRTTMAEWIWPLATYLADQGHSLYLLGNPPGVAAEAAARLRSHEPRLKILGTHHGFFAKTGPENQAVIEAINRARPDILMVGLGMPLEQFWILKYHSQVRARVFWEVGAAFEIWAGFQPACPAWLGRLGLNWLFRLMIEPRRLARRYLRGNLVFLVRLLKEWWAEHSPQNEAYTRSLPEGKPEGPAVQRDGQREAEFREFPGA